MSENVIKGRKQNHNTKGVLRAKRAEKKTQAEARKEAHDKLTTQQKIAELDMMFGKDQGAKKERARLLNPQPKKEEIKPKEEKAEAAVNQPTQQPVEETKQ